MGLNINHLLNAGKITAPFGKAKSLFGQLSQKTAPHCPSLAPNKI